MGKHKLIKKIVLSALMLVTAIIALVVPSFAYDAPISTANKSLYGGNIKFLNIAPNNAVIAYEFPTGMYLNDDLTVKAPTTPRTVTTENGSNYYNYTFSCQQFGDGSLLEYKTNQGVRGGLEITYPTLLYNRDDNYFKTAESLISYVFVRDMYTTYNFSVVYKGYGADGTFTQGKKYNVEVKYNDLPLEQRYTFSGLSGIRADAIIDQAHDDIYENLMTVSSIQIESSQASDVAMVGVMLRMPDDKNPFVGLSQRVVYDVDFSNSLATGLTDFLRIELFPGFQLSYVLLIAISAIIVFGIFRLIK